MNSPRLSFVRTFLFAFGLSGAALTVVACDTDEVPIGSDNQKIACNSSSDCPGDDVCANNVCETCAPSPETCDGVDDDCDGVVDNDATCPGGDVCINGQCAGNGGCQSDADCLLGEACVAGECEASACQPQTEACDGLDNDCDGLVDDGATCPANEVCANGACVPFGSCQVDADCAALEVCLNGLCEPGPCQAQAEACDGVDNDCDGIVDENNPCLSGATCVNGQCVGLDPCTTDADCAVGEVCVMGQCVDSLACQTDAECAPGEACINGVCEAACSPEPEACDGVDNDCDGVTDEEAPCPFLQTCQNGVCQ